jgi:hypothetical protein
MPVFFANVCGDETFGSISAFRFLALWGIEIFAADGMEHHNRRINRFDLPQKNPSICPRNVRWVKNFAGICCKFLSIEAHVTLLEFVKKHSKSMKGPLHVGLCHPFQFRGGENCYLHSNLACHYPAESKRFYSSALNTPLKILYPQGE